MQTFGERGDQIVLIDATGVIRIAQGLQDERNQVRVVAGRAAVKGDVRDAEWAALTNEPDRDVFVEWRVTLDPRVRVRSDVHNHAFRCGFGFEPAHTPIDEQHGARDWLGT